MGKPNAKKLEKKRRAKKQEKRQSNAAAAGVITPYSGTKYRIDEYIPFFASTETAINETSAMTNGQLTDQQVRDALGTLIRRIQGGQVSLDLPVAPPQPTGGVLNGCEEIVIWNILSRWRIHQENAALPSRDAIVGILRTTLDSIDVWSSPEAEARGYLQYVRGFLAKAGIRTQVIPAGEFLPEMDDD